jgi:hypothetical protein
MADTNQNNAPLFNTTPTYHSAYEAKKGELLALSNDVIAKRPRVDVSRSALTAEASAVKLVPFRPLIVATFGEPAGQLVDQLAPAARAAKQAHIEFVRAQPSGDLSDHEAEVVKSYGLLMNDAQSLVQHGFLVERDLAPARNLQGYGAKGDSLLVLVSLLREKWSVVHEHTPLTTEQIDQAEAAAQRLNTAIAHRDHGVNRVPAADMRNRALVNLVMINDEARRMMSYLRWHQEDVDEIVPSFWGDRVRKRAEAVEEEATPSSQLTTPTTPATPSEPELDPTGEGGPFTS